MSRVQPQIPAQAQQPCGECAQAHRCRDRRGSTGPADSDEEGQYRNTEVSSGKVYRYLIRNCGSTGRLLRWESRIRPHLPAVCVVNTYCARRTAPDETTDNGRAPARSPASDRIHRATGRGSGNLAEHERPVRNRKDTGGAVPAHHRTVPPVSTCPAFEVSQGQTAKLLGALIGPSSSASQAGSIARIRWTTRVQGGRLRAFSGAQAAHLWAPEAWCSRAATCNWRARTIRGSAVGGA